MKLQISIENLIIMIILASIALITVFIFIKFVPTSQTSYVPSISLDNININSSNLYLYLSESVPNPRKIYLVLENPSTQSTSNFSFVGCNYTKIQNPSFFVYEYFNGSNCNFNTFKGNHIIKEGYYIYSGSNIYFHILTGIINYTGSQTQKYYGSISISPSIIALNSTITATVSTNMKNAEYSLFLGTYLIRNCQYNSATNSCNFNVNSSIGATANSFEILNAYIFNSTLSEKTNTTFYVT